MTQPHKRKPTRYKTPYRNVKDKPRIKRRADWKVCSHYHCQLVLDGELLDHWHTRGKWMYEGTLWSGDVYEFIRDKQYEASLREAEGATP